MAVSNESAVIERQVVDVAPVRVRVMPDGRMTRQDAARYLGRAPKTLAMWAIDRTGPRFIKVGGRVFYYQAELDNFIQGKAA